MKSNYIYFDQKKLKHQLNIAKITFYYKIIKTQICQGDNFVGSKRMVY